MPTSKYFSVQLPTLPWSTAERRSFIEDPVLGPLRLHPMVWIQQDQLTWAKRAMGTRPCHDIKITDPMISHVPKKPAGALELSPPKSAGNHQGSLPLSFCLDAKPSDLNAFCSWSYIDAKSVCISNRWKSCRWQSAMDLLYLLFSWKGGWELWIYASSHKTPTNTEWLNP